MIKKINTDFYINWVLKDEIAIGPAPTKKDDIYKLKEKQITGILSLCSIKEVLPPENIENYFICKRIVLPDHTYDRAMNIEELKLSLIALANIRQKGPVFVHCKAAIERSPIICMAWLIKHHGLNIQQSLNYLMTVNKGSCPLKDQLSLLNKVVSN